MLAGEGLGMGDSRKQIVLVVDDELVNLTLIRAMLEDQGYQVVTALGPIEALRIWRELRGDVDVVLTDMVMPDMTGCDLFYKLRASKPDLRLAVVSGQPCGAEGDRMLADGALGWLQKPFTMPQLARLVERASGARVAS